MKTLIKKILTAIAMVASLGVVSSGPAHAAAVLGNLNDGLNHTSATTGFWSLFVNTGDVVTVTARRLVPTDIWGFATDGAGGTGIQIASGDDQLPPYAGGSWGDPQFSFTAATTAEYSVGVFRCCGANVEQIDYFVNSQGATGTGNAVPIPGTLALVGLGLVGLANSRRRKSV